MHEILHERTDISKYIKNVLFLCDAYFWIDPGVHFEMLASCLVNLVRSICCANCRVRIHVRIIKYMYA